jgi:hypothetical protein
MGHLLASVRRQWTVRNRVLRAVVALTLLLAPSYGVVAQTNSHPDSAQPSQGFFQRFGGWGDGKQSSLVQDVKVDSRGRIWVATEDSGLWTCNATNAQSTWTQFNKDTGLPDDNCRVLLCDTLGRVWVGTENSGLAVYNGVTWRNYDSLNGPLGSHIFSIAQDPLDGSIWISTENGLSRYSDSSKTWQYFTTADGLPSNQANVLAFDKVGDLFVGSHCDGMAIGSPSDGYKSWNVVPGPLRPPNAAGGHGLPSALINAILVAHDGTIYVGTDAGVADSRDSGKTWRYVRGADWTAKVAGQYPPSTYHPLPSIDPTLDEDYVISLAEDSFGHLWVGHRSTGLEIFDTDSFARLADSNSAFGGRNRKPIDFISSICMTAAGAVYGTYGGGLYITPFANASQTSEEIDSAKTPPLPSMASPPTVDAVAAATTRFMMSDKKIQAGEAYYLGEDWDTKGDWVGRYGRQYTTLCADRAPLNHDLIADARFTVKAILGPHCDHGDRLRYYVTWLKTDNPNSLYDPIPGFRRQAEWDDHGESYSRTVEGPDIWMAVTVPDGVHRLSFYLFNKDGAAGDNRFRDYLIEVRPNARDYSAVMAASPLAVARVVNFRGGVYKSFVLCGPSTYYVRLNRNNSLNTIVSSVMIDKLSGPSYWTDALAPPWMGGMFYLPPDMGALQATDEHLLDKILEGQGPSSVRKYNAVLAGAAPAEKLMSALDDLFRFPCAYGDEEPDRLLLYRALVSEHAQPVILANARWFSHIWTEADRTSFDSAMAAARGQLLHYYPQFKTMEF